jgi:hypothetical protein
MNNKEIQNGSKVMLAAGLFDLDEFIGYPILVVNNYFKDKGWEMVDCFNDYKWVWTKLDLNKSIVAKVDFVDDEILGNEVVNSIWWYDGIYSEPCR